MSCLDKTSFKTLVLIYRMSNSTKSMLWWIGKLTFKHQLHNQSSIKDSLQETVKTNIEGNSRNRWRSLTKRNSVKKRSRWSMKWETTKIWLNGLLRNQMQLHLLGRELPTSLACPNKKTNARSMHDSNTRKNYVSKWRSKSRGRKFSKDWLRLRTSKMNSGTFKNDSDLLAESDKRLSKKAGN